MPRLGLPGTWRCKECHGWDYRGAEGAYASGSHFTGIKGVRRTAGMPADEIHQIIMDETHGFTAHTMPHSAMEKIALFLSVGQIDMVTLAVLDIEDLVDILAYTQTLPVE